MSEEAEAEVLHPLELLNLREQQWRRMLESVSLAAEITVDAHEAAQTLGVLGRMFRLANGERARRVRMRRWPAVHVLSTTMVATEHYAMGTFWPKLSAQAGIQLDASYQSEWGKAYLDNLETLGMPTFDGSTDAGTRYVGRVLMHCGIPTSALQEYFRLVSERRRIVPGLTAEEFVSWAAGAQLRNIDRPIVRFLRYGGEFAVDVTDRTFDLLDSVRGSGDAGLAMLPERFRLEAEELHRRESIERPSRSSRSVDVDAATQPTLVLNPYGRGLTLRLPAVSEAPDGQAAWVVAIDSQQSRIETKAVWPGSSEPTPATHVTLSVPARQVTAALEGYEHLASVLTVVDDEFPLLAFNEEGHRLPTGIPWRDSSVWMLFPGGVEKLEVAGDLEVLVEGAVPPGWAGWSLILADLSRVTALALAGFSVSQSVRRNASARVVTEDPLAGVTTQAGGAVWAEPPVVELPEEGGQEAHWEISVADAHGTVIVKETYIGGGVVEDLWDALPRPLFGTFTLRVRGPWGRGVARSLAIIEGLKVVTNPTWRRLTGRGLVPSSVTLAGDGLELPASVFDFEADRIQAHVRIGSAGEWRTLLLEPPHMSIVYQTADLTRGPTVRPISLATEDVVNEPGKLTIELGAVGDPRLHLFARDQHLQVIEPGNDTGGGIRRFDMSRIVDTLREHPIARLSLDPEGQLDVASFRPRRLVSGVRMGDDELVFTDAVDEPGMVALIYCTRAPWRVGISVPISNGRAALPEHLREAGPLIVSVRIDDPWLPEPIPAWAPERKGLLAESVGALRVGTHDEVVLSAFLAGTESLPDTLSDLAPAWTSFGHIHRLNLQERLSQTRKELVRLLSQDMVASLKSLPTSVLDAAEQPAALIRSGLAWSRGNCLVQVEDLDWTRRGVLASSLLLPHVAESQMDLAIDEISAVCGEDVRSLIKGADPHPQAGRYDAQSDMFDRFSPAERSDLTKHLGLVPHGLLHQDFRVQASIDLLNNRKEPELGWILKDSGGLLEQLVRLMGMLRDSKSLGLIQGRCHPAKQKGWQTLSALSVGLALAARHAARGSEAAGNWLPRQTKAWAGLAVVAPDLVTQDLILAELLLRSTELTGEEDSQ